MGSLPFEKIKRELVVINSDLDRAPNKRELSVEELLNNGIIIIDKQPGPTSHQVSDAVKQILHISKAGHSGTLDPNVTGVLPVALGVGTKIIQALLNAGKEYVCVMHVHDDISEEKIKETLQSFVGKIEQLPPVKSAVKRQKRFRTVYYIEIMEIEERDVLFRVGCQAGTYIRKLCSDIGEYLGCGAHMAELRRTKAGPFNESDIHTLFDLKDSFYSYTENKDSTELKKIILPLESALKHLPKIWVKDKIIKALATGMQLKYSGIVKLHKNIKKGEMVAVMNLDNELILLGTTLYDTTSKINDNKIFVKTLRVFKNYN